jgi:hypothetical protein
VVRFRSPAGGFIHGTRVRAIPPEDTIPHDGDFPFLAPLRFELSLFLIESQEEQTFRHELGESPALEVNSPSHGRVAASAR